MEPDAELRRRLEGLILAARELAHLLNNTLTLPIGVLEILQRRTDLPPEVQAMLDEAAAALESAEEHVRTFQQIVRVDTEDRP